MEDCGDGVRNWLACQLSSGCIREVPAPEGMLSQSSASCACVAAGNRWYDDGVALDWSGLHRRLSGESAGWTPSGEDLGPCVRELNDYGAVQLNEFGEGRCVVTVLELESPWELQPLDREGSKLCCFSTRKVAQETPNTPSELAWYSFSRGPCGFYPVVKDVNIFLASLVKQLRGQGIRVARFLGSVILFEGDGQALMHRTAAVHKAITSAGLRIHTHRSSYAPQPLVSLGVSSNAGQALTFTSCQLEGLQEETDIVLFAADLFYQWLQDSYAWRCIPPVKVFPKSDSTRAGRGSMDEALKQRRRDLFLKFFDTVVRPHAARRLGFRGLQEMLDLDTEGFLEQCDVQLREKRKLVGPQKWTALDLRLSLCNMDAYSVSSVSLFQCTN